MDGPTKDEKQAQDKPLQPPAITEGLSTHTIDPGRISRLKSVIIIIILAAVSFLNTIGSSILISALPRIAIVDLNLS